jgi:phage terminase small subunit
MALNPKQQRFVAEYLKDLNATQAAIRAGYSEKTAKQIGSRLLTNVDVAEAIAKGQEKIAEKAGVTVEKIIDELAKLGFSNMEDFASVGPDGSPALDCSKLNRNQWAAVNQIKVDDDGGVTLKLYDKRAALVDLGKHLGMFTDKSEHKVTLEPGENSTPLELARGLAFVLALAQREAGTAPAAPAAPPMKH